APASPPAACGSSSGLLSLQRRQPLGDGGALLHAINFRDAIDRVRVGAGEAHSASPGQGAIKSLFGRVDLLFGRAIRTGRTITPECCLPPRDQVGLQRVLHLALAGAERGEAVLELLLLFARLA